MPLQLPGFIHLLEGHLNEFPGNLHPEEKDLDRGRHAPTRERLRAGRAAARLAMESRGFGSVAIPRGSLGQPLWPEGITGSISHSGDRCAAAIAATDQTPNLGLDLETREDLPQNLWSRILKSGEREELKQLPTHQQTKQALVLFSAKEALYKCLAPRVGKWFGFQDAHLRAHGDGSLEVLALDSEVATALRDVSLRGRFAVRDHSVLTTFWLKR